MVVFLDEVPLQALGGKVGRDCCGIKSGPGGLDRELIDVGRENLHRTVGLRADQALPQENRS